MIGILLLLASHAHAVCPIKTANPTVSITSNTLILDGVAYPTNGLSNRVAIREMFVRCNAVEVANSFSEFKRQRRLSNTWFGLAYPSAGIGLIPAFIHNSNAKAWKHKTIAAIQRLRPYDEQSSTTKDFGVDSLRTYTGSGSSESTTSLCGAPTTKGGTCRRKVKGGGRCYQH